MKYLKKMPRQMSFPFSEAKARSRVTYQGPERRNQIISRLEDALLREPPPSLHSIARSLRMSSSTQLREIEPDLSRQLTELGQSWKEKQEAALRAVFENALTSERPVSLETFCKSRGISYSVIRREYPDIKAAYTARFRILRKQAKEVESTQRHIAVAEAISEIPPARRIPLGGPREVHEPKAKGCWLGRNTSRDPAALISRRKKPTRQSRTCTLIVCSPSMVHQWTQESSSQADFCLQRLCTAFTNATFRL